MEFESYFPKKRAEMIKRTNSHKKYNNKTNSNSSTKDLFLNSGKNGSALRYSQRKIHQN